jgi:hypothetical protein
MRKLPKILAMVVLMSIVLVTSSAMAVVVIGGGEVVAFLTEPGAMLFLGTSLVGMTGVWRSKVFTRRRN